MNPTLPTHRHEPPRERAPALQLTASWENPAASLAERYELYERQLLGNVLNPRWDDDRSRVEVGRMRPGLKRDMLEVAIVPYRAGDNFVDEKGVIFAMGPRAAEAEQEMVEVNRVSLVGPTLAMNLEAFAALDHEAERLLVAADWGERPNDERVLERVKRAAEPRDAAAGENGFVCLADLGEETEAPPLIPTGCAWFDRGTDGGIRPATVTVVAGSPGAGKTAASLQLILGLLLNSPKSVALWGNLEMTPFDLRRRLVACASRVPVKLLERDLATLSPLQREAIANGRAAVADAGQRLYFCNDPRPSTIAQHARKCRASIAVVDHLQLVHPTEQAESRRHEIDAAVRTFREASNKSGVAWLVLSSVAKQSGGRVDATNFAKESGSIGFDADSAYLLEIPSEASMADSTWVMRFRCLKNRHAEPRDMHVLFRRAEQRFEADGGAR